MTCQSTSITPAQSTNCPTLYRRRFRPIVAFSASVTRPTFSNFFGPTCAIFSFNHSRCHKMFLFLSSNHVAKKKAAWCLCYLCKSYLIVLSHRNTNIISFDFFAVQEIRSIFRMNHISVASSFFCNCFEIVQASHPFFRMDSI